MFFIPVWLNLMCGYAAQVNNATIFRLANFFHLLMASLSHMTESSNVDRHGLVPVDFGGRQAF